MHAWTHVNASARCARQGGESWGRTRGSRAGAPGEIADWQEGAAGWVLWISLAIMLGDSLTSLSLLLGSSVAAAFSRRRGAARAPGLRLGYHMVGYPGVAPL